MVFMGARLHFRALFRKGSPQFCWESEAQRSNRRSFDSAEERFAQDDRFVVGSGS
jgi:hypothetical protein